ncbi:hypothetical protein H8E77_06815 [bacterium]|nr:hypothetical protein [bacterium]
MEDIKERASKVASQKSKRQTSAKPLVTHDVTSYNDFIDNYDTSFITTNEGKTYEIQKVDPGTYMSITGSPLIASLSEQNIDMSDSDEIEQAVNNMSATEKLQYVQSDDFLLFMQKMVCAGIVSLKFVCKRQHECNKLRKELSIDLLSGNDLMELYNAVMALSLPESEREMAENFRETGKREQEQSDTHSSDSGEISPDA